MAEALVLGILVALAQAAGTPSLADIEFDLGKTTATGNQVAADGAEILVSGRRYDEHFRLQEPAFAQPRAPRIVLDLGGGAQGQFDTKQGRLGDAQIGIVVTWPF